MKNLMFFSILWISSVSADAIPNWYNTDAPQFVGEVVTISSTNISLDDLYFKLSPTVKVSTLKLKKAPLSKIKVGDLVGLTTITFNGKQYVDHIYLRNFAK